MARRKVTFVQGHYYHIYNRDSNREAIFRAPENDLFLLKRLGRFAVQKSIAVVAYCLMPNHYHFLLRQDGTHKISEFIQAVFNSYSKAFNKRHNRTGTLFEGPFKSIHVDKRDYLVYLCRYIHRNPLEAGLVSDLEEWPYSNYLEWIGLRNGKLVDLAFVRDYFKSVDDYRVFSVGEEANNKIRNYMFDE